MRYFIDKVLIFWWELDSFEFFFLLTDKAEKWEWSAVSYVGQISGCRPFNMVIAAQDNLMFRQTSQ